MRLLLLLIKIMKKKRSLLIHYKREVAEQLQLFFFRYQTMQPLNMKPQEARIINFAAYTDAVNDQNHASNSFWL